MTEVQSEERLGSSMLERIGNTPLIRLGGLVQGLKGIALLGNAEWANPGGSVKDRAAAIVTVLPDSAYKYLSERFWEET
jgi:cysteine synthase B